jgi:hypothetical protein
MDTVTEDPVPGIDAPNYGAEAVAAQAEGQPIPPITTTEPLNELAARVAEPPPANSRQVGGSHYTSGGGWQHWDLVHLLKMDYYTGQITRYLSRAHKKNGRQDYAKAVHYMDKRRELGLPVFLAPALMDDPSGGPGRFSVSTVLWDFCEAQKMPSMARSAFTYLMLGNEAMAYEAAVWCNDHWTATDGVPA